MMCFLNSPSAISNLLPAMYPLTTLLSESYCRAASRWILKPWLLLAGVRSGTVSAATAGRIKLIRGVAVMPRFRCRRLFCAFIFSICSCVGPKLRYPNSGRLYTSPSLVQACCMKGRRLMLPKEPSMVFLDRSSSAFSPFITWAVISCPQKHTLHLFVGLGSCRMTFVVNTWLGCTANDAANPISTLRSPSSKPQRQAGVQGERTVDPAHTLVEPMIWYSPVKPSCRLVPAAAMCNGDLLKRYWYRVAQSASIHRPG